MAFLGNCLGLVLELFRNCLGIALELYGNCFVMVDMTVWSSRLYGCLEYLWKLGLRGSIEERERERERERKERRENRERERSEREREERERERERERLFKHTLLHNLSESAC